MAFARRTSWLSTYALAVRRIAARRGALDGLAKYNFTGGNNDADEVPLDGLIAAATPSLAARGTQSRDLQSRHGPQGYRPLREFLVAKLKRDAGMSCTADDILIVSGSLQALDLVNGALLARGDTVICEKDCYQGTLTRFARRGVTAIGIPLDQDGMRMDALAAALADCKQRGVQPKMIYVIPTVQNPTRHDHARGAARRAAAAFRAIRRAGVRGRLLLRPDLGRQAPARALCDEQSAERDPTSERSRSRSRRRCASAFSSPRGRSCRASCRSRPTRAPARSSSCLLAEYCAEQFATHLPVLRKALRKKVETLMEH
jgi:2-aminoadipate transaminase